MLYERLALSSNKDKVKKLSEKGQVVSKPEDLVKDHLVFEFLGLKEVVSEKDLEKALIDNLQKFLLELGKGFSFVSRQKRITIEDHYYVDLVFYNYILKCFVLVDLKIGKLSHKDIGQMDFYVRYFEKKVKKEEDNPTIGIILCSDKNETMVKYTILNESKQLFATKYQLYLPTKEEFKEEIKKVKSSVE
jgi:predicted nuclease of restriction endonuclease-like (RecB) superfamily